jgi:hypothetical protein
MCAARASTLVSTTGAAAAKRVVPPKAVAWPLDDGMMLFNDITPIQLCIDMNRFR